MYTIINDKKYPIIPYTTFKNKLIGLTFKKKPIKEIYLFKHCKSIHTFFMKQNIDICFLDKNYKILKTQENLKKNKILIGKGYYTLEMPLNLAKHLKIGDVLQIKKQ